MFGDEGPSVSIIIPTKNRVDLLRRCVESIRNLTTYTNYRIVIADNGSDDPQTLDYLRTIDATGFAASSRRPGDSASRI